MPLLSAEESVLLMVDLQQKLMPAIADGDAVVAECLKLAQIARLLAIPIVGTEQNPGKLGPNLEPLRGFCDSVIAKNHFDACADGLLTALPPGRRSIVVAGCEAHVCLLQTALGLVEHGYDVRVVRDAIGSRRVCDRDAALQRLDRHGAHLMSSEMVAFEWLRSCDHPRFRDVLKLIK